MKKGLTIAAAVGVITVLTAETSSWASSPTVVAPAPTVAIPAPTVAIPAPTVAIPAPVAVPNPGLDYVNTVVAQLGSALIPDYNFLAAVITAYTVPTNPNVNAATVCLEQTSNGRIYRLHSKNSAANGLVTNPSDLAVFNWNFFSLNKGDPVNFTVSSDVSNPASPPASYTGKVVAKNGNAICFARYLKQ